MKLLNYITQPLDSRKIGLAGPPYGEVAHLGFDPFPELKFAVSLLAPAKCEVQRYSALHFRSATGACEHAPYVLPDPARCGITHV